MSNTEAPLMQALTSQMRYLTQRQGVLAQNVANIDTPGYKAQDIKAPDFTKLMEENTPRGRLPMRTTNGKHIIDPSAGSNAYVASDITDAFEITPSGNNVTLEQEMAKISNTGMQYQVASNMFRKFTTMYRSALGK